MRRYQRSTMVVLALPKCVLATAPTPNTVQTIVVKVAQIDRALLLTFLQGQILAGQGIAAIVQIGDFEVEPGLYLVLTSEKPRKLVHWEGGLRNALGKLQGSPELCWARVFTPRLQRLFGWGDASKTCADVGEAARLGDKCELHAIMPGLSEFHEKGGVVDPVQLYDALQKPVAAIQDCRHDFQPAPWGAAERCANGLPVYGEKPRHTAPYWRCEHCGMDLCLACARALEEQQEERRDFDEAVKEVQKHSTTRDVDITFVWQSHPERPLPFFVLNPKNLSPDERLAWVTQELHESKRSYGEVDLEEFAQTFVGIFGRVPRGEAYQKKICLETFARYQSAPAGWKVERDLPPSELERFQRVWDPQAPRRCLECGTKLEPGSVDYCGAACRPKQILGACAECGCEEMVTKKGSGFKYCTDCGTIRELFLPVKKNGETRLMRGTVGSWVEDETRQPAWKLRRRS